MRLFALFTVHLLCNACLAATLVGQTVPPFPENWDEQGGACISRVLGEGRNCDYSIGVLHTPNGPRLYIGKAVPQTETNRPRWLVTDEMPYPQMQKGSELIYSQCERFGKFDETVIAVVKIDAESWFAKIQRAFKANLQTGKFERIASKGVRCNIERGDP